VPKSQPKACDPLFKAWRDAGMLKEKHKWRRLNMAIDKGQISLAKYIATLFPANTAAARRAQKFLKVYSNPRLVSKRHLFNSKSAQDADILIYGIRRIGRIDTDKAITILAQYKNFSSMTAAVTLPAKKTIAFHVLSKPTTASKDWLLGQLNGGVNEDIAVYAARLALVYEDWQALAKAISLMPASHQKQQRWQYWQIRADLALNNITEPAIIKERFSALAAQRDYYGFLAADLSGTPYALNDAATKPDAALLKHVAQIPGVRIALELYATGATLDAYREWHRVLHRLKSDELIAAAYLASDWGWHNAAINATIRGSHWDELALRFPLAYREAMQRGSLSADIPLSWAWAIARQESALRADARSHAGAQGLMQLMPGTARATISRQSLGISKPKLSNIEENSRIATAHLGEMLRRFNNNRAMASAAYNAGPHRVDQWLARINKPQALDIWIDSTPFKETRNYMQNVLMFSAVYDYLRDKEPLFLYPAENTVTP
jgi:soluble lytic murein transglycosylase